METFFSQNAERLVKERGLSKAKMCSLLGTSRSNWNAIIKTNNIEVLMKISRILDIPVDTLIGENLSRPLVSGYLIVNGKLRIVNSRDDLKTVLEEIDRVEKP